MNLKNYFKLLFFLFLFAYCSNVYAYEKYSVGDYAYFDPITTNNCNEDNYWTEYGDKNNTCYRFIVLDSTDDSSKGTLKIMLDHNLGIGNFEESGNLLSSLTSNWNRYSGNITLPDENTIATLMNLQNGPTIENSVNGGVRIYTLLTNTMYYYNHEKINSAGYWLSGDYSPNTNYAYTVTEYANNKLVEKTSSRGIRPMLIVNKSLLTKSSSGVDISDYLSSAVEYKYNYPTQKYGGYTYKQLQGFTLTNSKLVFHSSNTGNPSYGLVISYGGDNYSSLNRIDYSSTYHGNAMTFNSRANKVLVAGPDDGKTLYEYDGDSLQKTSEYNSTNGYNSDFTAIGYDKYHNYYVGQSGRRIYILNNNFNILYSFDCEHLLTSQDLEYDNGYIYYVAFESGTKSSNQMYYFGEPYSAKVLVYNAKFKSDGTPDENFGRLVNVLNISNINRDGLGGTGELEGISFHGNEAWFGYAAQKYDSDYTFKFYKIDKSKIAIKPIFTSSVSEFDDKSTITLNSNTELSAPNGWTLSNDKKSISKDFYDSINNSFINLCDTYNNCNNVKLPDLKLKKQDISFADNLVYKELKDESVTIPAIFNGNSNINYSSSDNSIATVDSTGKVIFKRTGTVRITAIASKNSNYYKGETSYVLQITKSDQEVSFSTSSVNKKYGDSSFILAANHSEGDGIITYSSTDENVAIVDNAGKVTIIGKGTANIVATASETNLYKPISASYSINVSSNPQSISFEYSSIVKKLSDKGFNVLVKQTLGNGNIIYKSSDEKVATIDNNGVIKFKNVGQTIITATAEATNNYDSSSASFTLNIDKGIQKISIENNIKEIVKTLKSDPFKLNVLVDGDGQLSYASSNKSVATISSDGLININESGKTNITVIANETDNYLTSENMIQLKVIEEDVIKNVPDTSYFDRYRYIIWIVSGFVVAVGLFIILKIYNNKNNFTYLK